MKLEESACDIQLFLYVFIATAFAGIIALPSWLILLCPGRNAEYCMPRLHNIVKHAKCPRWCSGDVTSEPSAFAAGYVAVSPQMTKEEDPNRVGERDLVVVFR